MRNLKRALSLALASVMLLGMMVVGTSAASYPDVDENDNVEAIEVLNAVSVMIGDRGNFRPDAAVNRHEMATIMAKLVLGVETADNYVGTHPFTDVFPWADKYVAACYENGLVAGTSATTFGGNQPLTAVQAAAMMLRALGYKDLSKGATDWRAPVTAMANQIRLFDGVASNPSEQLTRNQVAQLALNTLKSPMVNLKDNTISWSNDEGQIIMTGGSREYIALSSNEAYAKAINDTEKAGTSASQIAGFTVELGEHLYNGKLKLNNNYLDVFGRPARHWEFDGKEIGSYIKEELMVMDNVGKVTGNDLYSLLGASTIKDYDTLVTIDGVANDRSDAKDILGDAYFDEADMNRNNKDKVGATGTGVLTQVFVDHEKDEVYVAVINTYLARASKDYDEKAEEATLTVYGIDEYRTSKEFVKDQGNSETMKVQNEDFDLVKDVQKDDPYLVTVADGEIQTMVADEVLEGVTLTAFKLTDHVVSDGTEYAYTTTATYKDGDLDVYTGNGTTNLKDITYNIYLDAYDNLIGIEEVDSVKNYVFLAGIDVDGSNLYSKTATANALFLDGTSKTIKINLSKSDFPTHTALNNTNVVISGDALLNTWCTYTVSGDVYTVKEAYATRINEAHPALDEKDHGIVVSADNYPGHGKNTTKLAQTWQPAAGLDENNYTVDVKRMRLHGTTSTDGSAYANIYGDSTSVYLTAELDELYNDSNKLNVGNSYGIVKGVDSVTTGVADTSIQVWNETEARTEAEGSIKSQDVGATAFGIYTLYDSDGIVIASVVIGENDGVKDLVYVHTDKLDLESYDSAKDIWTWTRKVVFEGKEITLTEKGDGVSDLEEMLQYQWYEIKRDADGNIISADPAFHALGEYEEDPDYKIDEKGYFVTLYKNINTRVETSNSDTVLYQTSGGPQDYTTDPVCHKHGGLKDDLVVIGNNTLAVTTLQGSGIHFRDNVNVVLQYYNQNTKRTEIETGTGVDALKNMVDFVNDNNDVRGNDLYWLSAVIEKGFATTVVIYDSYNNYKRPDVDLGTYELTLGGVLNSIYTTPADMNSDVYLVDDVTGNITYVESNDSVATSTVNGYKRYTIPYGETVRIYDNDVGDKDFVPFFSPIWAVVDYKGYNDYTIGADSRTGRTYLEFTISERLTDNKLTVRERLDTDGIYVGVAADTKATVTVNGKAWDALYNCSVVPERGTIRIKADKGASVYVNGKLLTTPDEGTTDTYTFQAAKTDSYIIISTEGGDVTPDTYTVTVAKTANGSASVDKSTGLEGGETITVTTTPDEGYELDTISVDGTAIEGNTFTMPKKDVIVTATFKAIVPPVEGITFTGSAVKDTDFTATKNADGSYTIKAVDTTLGVKVYDDGDCGYTATDKSGNRTEWTITPDAANTEIVVKINKFEWQVVVGDDGSFGLKAVEVMPKSLSRARTMADVATISSKSAADGFMKISFTGIDGLKDAYVVKLEAREVNGVATTAYWFGKDNTPAELQTLADKLNAAKGDFKVKADPNVSDEEKDAWTGGTGVVDTIKAEITGTNIEIYAYDVENDRPTQDEVKAAIAEVLKKTNPSVTAADVTIDGTKVTVKGETQDYTLNPEYKALYKVTVNSEAAQYVKTGGTASVKDEKITNLLPSDKKVVAAVGNTVAVDATKHTFTFDGKKDTEYKTALKLAAAITNGAGYSLQYNDGTKTAESWKNLTLGSYIQAGVGIAVVGAATSGSEVAATVNKVEGKATAVNSTVVIKFLDGVTAYAKNDDGEDETEIKIAIGGMTYTVNWNGTALTSGTKTKWAEGDKITLTSTQLTDGAKYIAGKSKVGTTGDVAPTTDANGSYFTLTGAAAMDTADGETDGVINIYPAFVVVDSEGTDVKIADKATGTDAIAFTDGQAKLVAANTKLVMTAETANTLIGTVKDNAHKWKDTDLTLVTKPMANTGNTNPADDHKAIYELTLTKDITAADDTDFKVSKKAIAPASSSNGATGHEIVLGTAKGVTNNTAVWTLSSGVDYAVSMPLTKTDFVNLTKDAMIDVRWQTGTSAELLKTKVTAKVTAEDTDPGTLGQDTISFTVASASGKAEVALGATALPGTLVVTIDDTFQFEVGVKVNAPAAKPTASATSANVKVVEGDETEMKAQVTHTPSASTTGNYSWTVDGKSVEGDTKDLVVSTLGLSVGAHDVVCYVSETTTATGATTYAEKVEFKVVVFPKAAPTPSATTASVTTNTAGKVVTFTGLPTGCTVAAASSDASSDTETATVATDAASGGIKVTPKKAGSITVKVTVTHGATSLTQDYTFTFTIEA